MQQPKLLWHFVWTWIVPFVVGQMPAIAVVVWERSTNQNDFLGSMLASGLGIVGSAIWALADWRITRLSTQLENDARDFRNTADSQIVEVNNATRRGIVQVGDIFRILKYDHATGTLFNSTAGDPERTPRNILLNNTTIQTILDKIVRSASDPAEGRKHLREAGFECGQHFGTLVNQMKGTGEPDLVPILREWFEYDSNAGFGKFDLVDDGPGSIKIVLRYNFLLTGNEYIRPEKNLCEYMTGYIHGVISALPGASLRRKGFEPKYVVVEHPKEYCICDQKMYDLGCTFFVKGIA